MKYSIVTLSALAAFATAQSIGACDGKAQGCIDDAVASSGICEANDWYCACSNIEAIQGGATACVIKECGGAAGALDVITEVEAVCKEVLANPPKTEEPAPTESDAEPEPTESDAEPEPTESDAEPEPTESDAEPEPTDAEPEPTETDAEYPETSGTEEPEATETFEEANGAGSLVPAGALVAGLIALAL